MIDRDRYESEFAPPASELESRWTSRTPTGREIESFFLHELCESSEQEYFLCVSDVFLNAIERQGRAERISSLSIIPGRLLDAAEFARSLTDEALVKHYEASIHGFVAIYREVVSYDELESDPGLIRHAYLAMQALAMGDLPLARLILHCHREMVCVNQECDNCNKFQCPECQQNVTPYGFHKRYHNMMNVPGHPLH